MRRRRGSFGRAAATFLIAVLATVIAASALADSDRPSAYEIHPQSRLVRAGSAAVGDARGAVCGQL